MPEFAAAAQANVSFEEVLEAVLETARGRWFLAEFARRNRVADTHKIIAELQQMHSAVTDARAEILHRELAHMSDAVEAVRIRISQSQPPGAPHAIDSLAQRHELDAIVGALRDIEGRVKSLNAVRGLVPGGEDDGAKWDAAEAGRAGETPKPGELAVAEAPKARATITHEGAVNAPTSPISLGEPATGSQRR